MRTKFTLLLFIFTAVCSAAIAQTWQWGRGNTGSPVDGWAIATDPKGNVIAGGINFGNTQVTIGGVTLPNLGLNNYQTIIVKYDTHGNLLWASGTQNGDTYLISITSDPVGNAIVFGSFKSLTMQIGTRTLTNSVFPNPQFFLAKLDLGGNVLWATNGGNSAFGYTTLGNMAILLGAGGVATDVNGYIYIAAHFYKSSIAVGSNTLVNANPTGKKNDILLAKYDPAGNVVWARSAGGSGNDEVYGITVTPAGDVYIAGVFDSPSLPFGGNVIHNISGSMNAFIARYDGDGNALWASASGGTGSEYAAGLASDLSGNVYLTGGLKDNSISFAGTSIVNPDTVPVLYLVKFDPSNSVSWYKTIGPAIDSGLGAWGYSIAVSHCGIVWVSGCMHSDLTIDGHNLARPDLSTDPIFMAGYSASGTYVGSTALQSGGDDQNGIACDDAGNVFMSCDYETFPFKIGNDEFPAPTSATGELLYVAKYATGNTPEKNAVTAKTELCLINFVTLAAHGGYTNYLWNDGRKAPSRSVSDTGIYWVLGFDSCSNATIDTFTVTASCDCHKSVFVPNSFTPNSDGENDVFYPRSGPNVKKIKTFRVYNRWGELLFERENLDPNDASNAWDGTYKGNLPLPDVYVWVVEAICANDLQVNKKGSVTIIR